MRVIRSPKALRLFLSSLPEKTSVGFVPTMGYLHEGHLSLVRRSRRENDLTVVSIFVNPMQFGPKEDLSRYPRDLRRDRALLKGVGTDVLFLPTAADMYPLDFQTTVSVGGVSLGLCGKSRPTHFAGVATVVMKLLHTVWPDVLYLGQKDYQQCRVIETMVRDLDCPVKIRRVPIYREKDGVAMSSRNVLLSNEERLEARSLSVALKAAENIVRRGEKRAVRVLDQIRALLKSLVLGEIDYAEIVDARSMTPVVKLTSGSKVVVALAVKFSKTRLIDNTEIRVP